MPLLQGLIFDLDGTLLDSAADLRQAINLTLRDEGLRALTLDEVKGTLGDGLMPMLGRAFTMAGKPLENSEAYARSADFLAYYRGIEPDPDQLYPHAVEMLTRFRGAGTKLGLCTNKQEAATLHLLERLELTKFFDFVAGGDTFPVHKPHPGHVRGVIERLKAPLEGCVMIGDSANDVLAAQGTGIPCIAVTHGYGDNMESLGADSLIGGFKELPQALEKLGFKTGNNS